MADVNLTNGVLKTILTTSNTSLKPVLQVLGMKKIQSAESSAERYRIQLSDGVHFQPCMLATQMNSKIHSGELDKNCIVAIDKYTCNNIHERKIIIIINLRVLTKKSSVIGQPKQLDLVKVSEGAADSKPNQSGWSGGGGGGGAGGGGEVNRGQSYSGRGAMTNGVNSSTTTPYSSSGASPPKPVGMNTSSLSQRNVFPISSLNPYQNRWTIRVRVASKPSLRQWSNSRGEGRLFNVDLVDESGEIRAVAFNEVADKLLPMFQFNKVYYLSQGRLKPANKQFSSIKNEYELSLTEATEVEECFETTNVPKMSFSFTSIAVIESLPTDSIIDVIGVCREAADVQTVTTRTTNKQDEQRLKYYCAGITPVNHTQEIDRLVTNIEQMMTL